MSGVSTAFLDKTSTCYRLLPILTPYLKKNSWEKDDDLRNQRVLITGIATFAIAAMVCSILFFSRNSFIQISTHSEDLSPALTILACFLVIFNCSFLVSITSSVAIIICDVERTNQAADAKAVEEYMNSVTPPSKEATSHIQHRFTALQLLIARGGYVSVNKKNVNEERLLDDPPNLKIYELLTMHADTKLLNRSGVSYFEKAIQNENPEYLKCILKHNKSNPTKITPDDFSVKQQMQFWQKASTVKTIYLLHEFGFNVNIQDNDGCTPLLKLLERISLGRHKYTIFTPSEKVSALLSCGADPTIEGMVREKGKEEKQKKTAVEIETPNEISKKISQILGKTNCFHPHYKSKSARFF